MASKNFRLNFIIRVLLLSMTMLFTLILILISRHYLSAIVFGVITLLQIYYLIRFVSQANFRITQFLNAIRYSDFAVSYHEKEMGSGFDELNHSLNEVIQEFRKTRAEKEEHYNYLQTVVQHINIGILAYRRDGVIDMYNNATRRLLNTGHLIHMNDLAQVRPALPDTLLRMQAGDRTLVKLFINKEVKQLLIYATEFKMRHEEYVLVAMQDIHAELEEKETESWQKLIRVLTHEIMNSMTPISSLASTVKSLLTDEDEKGLKDLDEEDIDNVKSALDTIQSRSQALLRFVEIYRNLSRIPKPNFRHFSVHDMVERARLLMSPKWEELGVSFDYKIIPPDLKLTADPDLLDQVIINLLLNAGDAMKGKSDPIIRIRAFEQDNGRVVIEITDNGHGITPDILDKIFMPFFTSKKEGSGIGLSLSRQIMHLHKGSISVKSVPGEGATFLLVF